MTGKFKFRKKMDEFSKMEKYLDEISQDLPIIAKSFQPTLYKK